MHFEYDLLGNRVIDGDICKRDEYEFSEPDSRLNVASTVGPVASWTYDVSGNLSDREIAPATMTI